MKTFFKDLFEYNFKFNQKILFALHEHPEKVSDRLIGLCSHLVNVHGIWNSKIIPEKKAYKRWEARRVKELIEIDTENFHSSLSIMEEFDLDASIQYSLSSGETYPGSIRDILFQIINHSTYHRGQIATEFRQCQMEPLLTDWIFYKMSQFY